MSLNLSILIVNIFYCVLNCLNTNRITVFLGIMTLIVSSTSCLSYNSERKKHEIPNSENEAKQNRYKFPCASFVIKCLEDFEEMTR